MIICRTVFLALVPQDAHMLTHHINFHRLFGLLLHYDQMAIFGFHDRPCLKSFESHCDELLSEYLDRIKTQVLKWFGNIKRQPLDIVTAVDKTLITSQPEDMFNIIHVQVEVAKEKLPAERLKDVVNACLQVCLLSILDTYYTHLSLIHIYLTLRNVRTGSTGCSASKLRSVVVHLATDGSW